MNISKLIAMYKEAEARSTPCVGGRGGEGGRSFTKADRAALIGEMWSLGLSAAQAGYAIQKEIGGTSDKIHAQRLKMFENQINKGVIRLANAPTGEHVGKYNKDKSEDTFEGRIRSKADIQPAFNRAARQLIKIGVTDPSEVVRYVNAAFSTAKLEQKIDKKADFILNELRMDMDNQTAKLVLQRVGQQL